MTTPAARLARARQRLAAGDVEEARREGEAVLGTNASDGNRADSYLLLAACAQQAGDPALGLRHARMSIALRPDDPMAHYLTAELEEAAGDKPGALASLDRAVALKPAFIQAWFYRGVLQGEGGDALAAIASFGEAVRLDPAHARAWNNLGNALRRLARLPEAGKAFERAVALKPDYWLAVANLAKSLRDASEVERAEALLRDALARSPSKAPYRPLLVLLAGLLRERGFLDESAQLYWRAIQAAPKESAQEWFHLGVVLGERGEPERAREAYGHSYGLDRRELRALFGMHLALPMVYADANEVDAARERFTQGLAALESALPKALEGLTSNQLIDGLRWTNFFLAYQGRDDRALQARYARIVHQAIAAGAPQWHGAIVRLPGSRRRVRIGFASAFLHVGTVGRYFRSWITALPRDRFEVFIYHLWPGMDEVATEIHARADTFHSFGG
ncbi:MAG: tetratricopeptide repeat protein, partial [Betaproteobacteria bacterium]